MKYVVGVITFITGLLFDILVFTQIGTTMIEKYSINLVYLLYISIIAFAISVVMIIKKERILSSLSLITNGIFIIYFIMLFTLV